MTKTPLDRFVRGRRPRCRIYTGEINSAFIKIVHCKDQRLTACHCMVEVDQDCSLARRKNSTLVSAAALHTPLPQRVNRDWAGASCRFSHVRNAPLATVGPEKGGPSLRANNDRLQRRKTASIFAARVPVKSVTDAVAA